MENTRIEYLSTEEKPTVEAEFAELLPPLPADQYELLEADLLKNGCYSPIIANEELCIATPAEVVARFVSDMFRMYHNYFNREM